MLEVKMSSFSRHVLLFVCIINLSIGDNKTYTTSFAIPGDNVILDCEQVVLSSDKRWTKDNQIIFHHRQKIEKLDNIYLFHNYSLFINPVSIEHSGTYTCLRNVFYLNVQVPPKVFINVNGKEYFPKDTISNTNDHITEYIYVSQNFTAECYAIGAKPAVNLTWTVDGEGLNSTSINYTKRSNYTVVDTTNMLTTLLVKDRGSITCTTSGLTNREQTLEEISITVHYIKYELPQLELVFKKGSTVNNVHYIARNEYVEVMCSSSGARPTAQLSWLLNGVNVTDRTETCSDSTNTHITTSCIKLRIDMLDQNITCIAELGNYSIKHKVSQSLDVYACPNMTLMINGEDITTAVVVNKDVNSTATCNITKHILQSQAHWEFDDGDVTILKEIPSYNTNTSIVIEMYFVPRLDNGNIVCIYTDIGGCEIQQNATFIIRDTKAVNKDTLDALHYLVMVLVIIIIVFLLAFILKKCFATRTMALTTLSSNVADVSLLSVSRALPPIYRNNMDTVNIGNIQPKFEDSPKIISNEENTSMWRSADVHLTYQLPGEGTIEYWVATRTAETDNEVTVIAKTVSENVKMKELLNFRELAKNVITLRKHDNIVDTIGVSLEDVPYFIYQEYIDYGTLKEFLLRNCQQSESDGTSVLVKHDKLFQLTLLAVGLCEGMLFLANHDYRHPGLAARKILLTSTERCKLYDFWPVNLAQERMKHILEVKAPPLAWLAPETIFLGHYLEKSDVWNFGVVVWEMYSLGNTPFGGFTCPEIESKLRAKENLVQPLTCPGGLYGTMLSMWSSSIEDRPSFECLLETLTFFLRDMKESCKYVGIETEGDEPHYFRLTKDGEDDDDYIDVVADT